MHFSCLSRVACRLCAIALTSIATASAAHSALAELTSKTVTPAAKPALLQPDVMPKRVRVALQKTLDPEFTIDVFAPTMRLLRRTYTETKFETELMSTGELADAVRTRKVDLFFADGALFGVLQLEYGAMQIASRTAPYLTDPSKATSFAVVVKAKSDLHSLAELAGRRIAADDPETLSTWLLFQGVMQKLQAPEGWDRNVHFSHYQYPDPILLVQQGRADATVVPTCRLEKLIDAKVVSATAMRVLNAASDDRFPCRRSADLFPDAVMGVSAGTSASAASALAVAVLSAPPFRSGDRWRIASDFTRSAELYKSLGIGPYRKPEDPTLLMLWERFRPLLAGALVVVLLLAAHSYAANRLVEKRTKALRQAVAEKEKADLAAAAARERLSDLERSTVVSELSSMLAHEVRQPLAAVTAYAGGIRLAAQYMQEPQADQKNLTREIAFASERLCEEAERVSEIVERVRSYAKATTHPHVEIALDTLAARAASTFRHSSLAEGVRIDIQGGAGLRILGEPLELELALVNLMRNSAAAMSDRPLGERRISIRISTEPGISAENAALFALIRTTDEGSAAGPISDAAFETLARPVKSKKPDGLGLGLVIVRRIMEAHGGSLLFRRCEPPSSGLVAELRLPLMPSTKEEHL